MDQGWTRFELVLIDLALLQTEGEMTGDYLIMDNVKALIVSTMGPIIVHES